MNDNDVLNMTPLQALQYVFELKEKLSLRERVNRMDIIKVMDDTLSNKIAAGEVVERPASIVKELVENAIDADSTVIEIALEEAGLLTIRVTDNGKGMSERRCCPSV